MDQRSQLTDALDLYYLDCRAQRFTADTLRYYRGRLSLFLRWCHENDLTFIDEITPTILRRYLVAVDARGVSSIYLHSHAKCLRTFFGFCVRDGLMAESPMRSVPMPRLEKKTLPALKDEQIRLVLDACESLRDKALLRFMLSSGVRAAELVRLNVGDVSANGSVRVVQGKGRKDRTAMIGPGEQRALQRYLITRKPIREDAPLFSTERGDNQRLSYPGLTQVFRRLTKRTGVKPLNAHTLRRTMAIRSLRAGMPEHVLAKLLGHSDVNVLRRYLDITVEDLRTMHDRHDPMKGL